MYENLSGTEFKEKFLASNNAMLVDVRTPGEYRAGTIKGAKNIDFMSPGFKQEFLKLPKDKEYFCSAAAATAAAKPVPCWPRKDTRYITWLTVLTIGRNSW